MQTISLESNAMISGFISRIKSWHSAGNPNLELKGVAKDFHVLLDSLDKGGRTAKEIVLDIKRKEIALWPKELHELIDKMFTVSKAVYKMTSNDSLAFCLSLGFFFMHELLATESVAAITLPFNNKPGQPNRDHVCHVLAVNHIMCNLVLFDEGKSIRDKVVSKLMKNQSILAECIKALDLEPYQVEEAVKRAVPLAAICHDLFYTREIAAWLSETNAINKIKEFSGLFDDNVAIYTNAIERLFKKRIYPWLNDKLYNKHSLDRLQTWFLNGIEIRKKNKDNDKGLDHGQKAAVLLLSIFTHPDFRCFWDNKIDKLALLIACLSIFNHCHFTKEEKERYQHYPEIPKSNKNQLPTFDSSEIWKYDPLGVVLALADLLAEAPRTHWTIATRPRTYSKAKWNRCLLLHHALCIPSCEIVIDNDIVITYELNVLKYPEPNVWPSGVKDKRFDAKTAILGENGGKEKICSDLAEHIFGKKKLCIIGKFNGTDLYKSKSCK